MLSARALLREHAARERATAGEARVGRALGLALAGLRARAATSLALLGLLVVALGAAVVGPVFLHAADESTVRQAVRESPLSARRVAVQTAITAKDPVGSLAAARQTLEADPVLRRVLRPAVTGGEVETTSGQGDVLPVVWRDGLCEHLVLRSGRCPAAVGEVAMAEPLPPAEGWRVGGVAAVQPGGELRIVGTYAPIDPSDPYWYGHAYEPADSAGDPTTTNRLVGAAFTVAASRGPLLRDGGRQRAVLDAEIDPDRVTSANASAVAAALDRLPGRLTRSAPDTSSTTGLADVLAAVEHTRDGLRLPVLLVTGQLALLALLVLGLVVEATGRARAPEIALARLRGLGPWRVAAFGLLEVVLLVVAALPLGLLVALPATRLAAAGRLSPGTPVALTRSAVLAGVVAVVVAVLATAWAGREVLRTPATELLRSTPARRRRGGLVAIVAVGVLAAAGAAELGRGGGLRSDRLDVVALATPGALALAVALVGSRLLPLACRALLPLTRGRGPVWLFLSTRQLARRPAGGRSVVVVATAFGLAAFAVFATSLQAQNRHDRALADNGAPVVYDVRPDPGVDVLAAARAADPGGHSMALLRYDSPDSSPGERRLLAVDSSRLAAVAWWRPDLAPGTTPQQLARALAPPVAAPVLLHGDAVRVGLDSTDRTPVAPPEADQAPATPDPPSVALEVDGVGGARQSFDLGPVSDGSRTLELPLTGCATSPCRLRALRVTRLIASDPVVVALTLRDLAVRQDGAWSPVDLGTADRWRSDLAPAAAGTGISAVLRGATGDEPALTPADTPTTVPALVTATAFRPLGQLRVPGLDGQDALATQVAVASLVPGGGADVALVDLTVADRAAVRGRSQQVTAQVWAGPGAPVDLRERLAARGLPVTGTTTAAQREALLARQGPALAVRLLVLAGVTGTALAAAGAALELVLLGRRRRYELAALQAAGLRLRSLTGSVLAEQVALLATGAVLGVAAGLVGGRLAAPSVPQFDDVDPGLPLLTGAAPGAVGLVLVGAAFAVLVVSLLTGAALLRGRGVERLREAQA